MARRCRRLELKTFDLNNVPEWITGVVADIDIQNAIIALSTPYDAVMLSFSPNTFQDIHTVWKGAKVSCQLSEGVVSTLVLEPEQILDVTEVAECITPSGDFPSLAILRSLQPRTSSVAALRGSLINSAFDVMVHSPTLLDDEVLQHVLRTKTLALASVGSYSAIVEDVKSSFSKLRAMLKVWEAYDIVVEPHVISSTVGLQGRFDILLTNAATNHVEIVELKSGSAPKRNRDNHAAQISAYACLYELIGDGKNAKCSLWYLTDNITPLRLLEPDTIKAYLQRVIRTRNQIVAFRHHLEHRDFSALKKLNGSSLRNAGIAAAFEDRFATTYQQADVLSRTSMQAWLSWLLREQMEVLSGDQQGRSTADLWRKSYVEKSDSPTVLLDLRAIESKSDPERMHVYFESPKCIDNTALRYGDLVFVHKKSTTNDPDLASTYLLFKGTVQHIEEYGVMVSLRNKQVEWGELFSTLWIMEQEVTISGLRTITGSLFWFLSATEERRHAILGCRPPQFGAVPRVSRGTLTEQQQDVVQQALSATDWFLVQGPPGTGKTSKVLRSIISELVSAKAGSSTVSSKPHEMSHGNVAESERVLVLAYTNRAVNEICTVLHDVLPQGSFYRHGTSSGIDVSLRSVSLPHMADGMQPEAISKMIANARCIVSTIHAVHSQPEIFSFGKFTTAVVDEASQVLDVQLAGILAQVSRHILIGDHKQLPPVVAQDDTRLTVNSPLLASVGISTLGQSIFERLANLCEQNGWKGALAMLEHQGRMHNDVMQFASHTFYNQKLQCIAPWQRNPSPLPWINRIPRRFIFFDVALVSDEAVLAVELAVYIVACAQERNEEYSVGIITPFRVQNRRVINLLPDHLRAEIMVDTVERFQGSQRDVIIYATSVSTQQEFDSIRSDSSGVDRKLNVAATRARHQFVMIGNRSVLSTSTSYAAAISMMNM